MHPLVRNLLGTFVISTVVAIGVNFSYYAYIMRGNTYDAVHILLSIGNGTLLLTVILAIMSIPVLFLQNINYWKNITVRVLLYFSGPVVFLVACFTQKLGDSDKIFHLLTGGVYIVVHTVFYFLPVRKLGGKQSSRS